MARPDVARTIGDGSPTCLCWRPEPARSSAGLSVRSSQAASLDAQADQLQALDGLRAERQAKLKANEAARARFDVRDAAPTDTLEALRAAAAGAGVPVLLYWTTYANVITWYVGPDGSDVRAVFLPASVLEEKVRNVVASSGVSFGRKPFDETTARELYLYLVAPFAARLNSASVNEIVIVPQGALARLPFEALVDPESAASVIDRWAVSYALNAAMAVAALQRQARPMRSVAALVDPTIDIITEGDIQYSGVRSRTRDRNAERAFRRVLAVRRPAYPDPWRVQSG